MKKFITLFVIAVLLISLTGIAQTTVFEQNQAKAFWNLKTTVFSPGEENLQQNLHFKNAGGLRQDFGDAPACEWAKKFDGSGQDVARKAVTDADGNTYLIGDFSGTMEFAGTTMTSVGMRDVFLAKFDNSGNLLWIKQGNSGAQKSCVMYDILKTENQVLMTGYFDGEAFNFDGSVVNLAGLSDAFVLKVSFDGQVAFLKNFGSGDDLNRGLAIAQDADQGIYLTGTTNGITGYYHPSFLGKIDQSGNVLWWQLHEIGFSDLAVSGNQLYVAGTAYYESWLGDIFLDPVGYNDAFVAKANLFGQYEWAVMGEHQQVYWGDSFEPQLAIGEGGDIFMAGYYRNNVEFGSILLSSGLRDAFIVRLNSSGDVIWANTTADTYNSLFGFTLLPNDQPCISGGMGAMATFDNIVLTTTGGAGNYVAIYNSSGSAQSAFTVTHQTSGLAVLPGSKIIQTGTTTLDAFIAGYDYAGALLNMNISNGNSGTAQLTGLEVDADGTVFSLNNILGYADFFGIILNTEKESMVLARQTPNGDILWRATMEGGISWSEYTETTLHLDEDGGRLLLHGNYKDTLRIDDLEFITPGGGGFLACYLTTGDFQWAKDIPWQVNIQSVDNDIAGNTYFILGFAGTIDIEGMPFTARNSGDALVLKYDISGNLIFARQLETDVFFYSLGIATIESGGYFLTVEPAGDTIFFNNGNNSMVFTPNDGRSVVAKYDDGGNYLWAKSFGYSPTNYGGFYSWATASVTDDDGNLYLTGTHGDSAMFDDIMLRTPYNRYSNYNAKIDADGNVLWANSIQIHRWGSNYCEADIDDEGNFYCMSEIRDTVNFDNWQYIPSGPGDMYVARYDNNGEINWVKTFGSNSLGNHLYGIAVFEPDNIFIGGNFINRIYVEEEDVYTSSSRAGLLIHIGDSIQYSAVQEKLPDDDFVLVYPNPAEDVVFLDFKDTYRQVEIEFADLTGRKINTLTLHNVTGNRKLDINRISKGTYLLKITADGTSATQKLLIR